MAGGKTSRIGPCLRHEAFGHQRVCRDVPGAVAPRSRVIGRCFPRASGAKRNTRSATRTLFMGSDEVLCDAIGSRYTRPNSRTYPSQPSDGVNRPPPGTGSGDCRWITWTSSLCYDARPCPSPLCDGPRELVAVWCTRSFAWSIEFSRALRQPLTFDHRSDIYVVSAHSWPSEAPAFENRNSKSTTLPMVLALTDKVIAEWVVLFRVQESGVMLWTWRR